MMNILKTIFSIFLLLFISCQGEDFESNGSKEGNVSVSSDFRGSLYVDGRYTGKELPATINLQPGEYLLSVGVEQGTPAYYRKQISITESSLDIEVVFQESDKVLPKTWKALWYGVPQVRVEGVCETNLPLDELEVWKNDFLEFVKIIERKSYGTLTWDVETYVFDEAIEIMNFRLANEDPLYQVRYEDNLKPVINNPPNLEEVDNIFIFWAVDTPPCSLPSNFGGFAYPNDVYKGCYCIQKGNPGNIAVRNYLSIDDLRFAEHGVWFHEWLHTTTEDDSIYADLGYEMPKADDYTVVHSNVQFGYSDSEDIQWYYDLIQGKVPSNVTEGKFLGLGPEALWSEQHTTYER